MATPDKVVITITRSADGSLRATSRRSALSNPASRTVGREPVQEISSGSIMGRKKAEKETKSSKVEEPETSDDKPLGEKAVRKSRSRKGSGKADTKPKSPPKNPTTRRTRGGACGQAAGSGSVAAESVAERTETGQDPPMVVNMDPPVQPANTEATVEKTALPQLDTTNADAVEVVGSAEGGTAAGAEGEVGGEAAKPAGTLPDVAGSGNAEKLPEKDTSVKGKGKGKPATGTGSVEGTVGKPPVAVRPSGAGHDEAGPSSQQTSQGGEIGSGEFYGKKISTEKLREITKIAENIREGKSAKEAEGLSAEEFKELARQVSEHQVKRRMDTMLEANAAYPTEGVGWEDRGGQHFDIPLCMFKNGNDIEKYGVVHSETDSAGRPKRVRVTERITTPAQVQTGEKIWASGHIKEKGDVTAVVKPFGKAVKITAVDREAMSQEDKRDLKIFEDMVASWCKSEDAGVKARGEWLREYVVGNWLFLVDGNSRYEGYLVGRKKTKDKYGTHKTVLFQTFLLRLDASNMDDICAMSRQINDNNIEFNSRKSVAQEVHACYDINDKSADEMEKIVSTKMLELYTSHTGKWVKLRKELEDSGVKYPGIIFAVALKPSLGLLLMDTSTLDLPATKVAELGQAKAQWALKRIHCANLSDDKRPYWEKKWSSWVMLQEPEKVVPDIDVLDQLSMKHLPIGWDTIVVKLLECSPETFKSITGFERTRANLMQWVKWMALIFNACEAAVIQLQDYGFYVKPEKRKRGESPRLGKAHVRFSGAYDVFEFGKAIVWMQTPDGPETRPFWWARKLPQFTGTLKKDVINPIRDRLTLAYFRTVEASRKFELTAPMLKYVALEQKLVNKVNPQFNVVPVTKLKDDLLTRAGFVKPSGTLFKNRDRTFKPSKAVMYADWDEPHLKAMKTTAFKEIIKGCRWDSDCGNTTPSVRVWDKGGEPNTLEKKWELATAPYMSAATVESILQPPESFAEWDRLRLLQIRPDSRLCVMAVQPEAAHPGPMTEVFPPLQEVLNRLAWVTSSSGSFDPSERPVHLCMYIAACAGEAKYDARARTEPAQAALGLMRDLLRYDGSVGIAILPGNTPVAWIPQELEVVAQRYMVFMNSGKQPVKFANWGSGGTVYQVLYLTPVGSELELPDEEKKYGPSVAHKKFKQAGTAMASSTRTIPELWSLKNINNILEGVVPETATDAVAVVLGEENGIATCALLGRGMQVVSVASRRLTVWEGGNGKKILSTPTKESFADRAESYRKGTKAMEQFEGVKVGAPLRTKDEKEAKLEALMEEGKGKEKEGEEGTAVAGRTGTDKGKRKLEEEVAEGAKQAPKKGKKGKGSAGEESAAAATKAKKRSGGPEGTSQEGRKKKQKAKADEGGEAADAGAETGSAEETAREPYGFVMPFSAADVDAEEDEGFEGAV